MKEQYLSGLANVNVELTSRCNKDCWCCGRRKTERDYPELTLKYEDMRFGLVKKIASQLPRNIMVQLHNNGEGLLYPRFGEAVKLFKSQITNIVTNGKLLVKKADEIINNLDTITISILENDPESDEQYKIIKEFLKIKGENKPNVILRLNGKVDASKYKKFGCIIATRLIHSEMGSYNYRKRNPTIPEAGICLDFLHHMAINSYGKVSICVRYDPKGVGFIGDANIQSLSEIWNGEKRMKWLDYHKRGQREKIPLCSYCHFWGVPTGFDYRVQNPKIDEKEVFGK